MPACGSQADRPWSRRGQRSILPLFSADSVGGSTSIKPDSNSLGTDLSYKPSTQMIRAAFLLPGATLSGKKVVISSKNMANPQLLGFHCILAPVFLAPVFPIKDHGFGQSTPKQPPHPTSPPAWFTLTRLLAITLVTLVKPPQFHKGTRASPLEGFL